VSRKAAKGAGMVMRRQLRGKAADEEEAVEEGTLDASEEAAPTKTREETDGAGRAKTGGTEEGRAKAGDKEARDKDYKLVVEEDARRALSDRALSDSAISDRNRDRRSWEPLEGIAAGLSSGGGGRGATVAERRATGLAVGLAPHVRGRHPPQSRLARTDRRTGWLSIACPTVVLTVFRTRLSFWRCVRAAATAWAVTAGGRWCGRASSAASATWPSSTPPWPARARSWYTANAHTLTKRFAACYAMLCYAMLCARVLMCVEGEQRGCV